MPCVCRKLQTLKEPMQWTHVSCLKRTSLNIKKKPKCIETEIPSGYLLWGTIILFLKNI